MSILTQAPESLSQRYEWQTDIHSSRNGKEQRISLRQHPRQEFIVGYLADSDEKIQYWKSEFILRLDDTWQFPLWHEAEKLTAPVVALDTTLDADFTLMDDSLGPTMVVIHPNGVTHEVFAATLPRAAGQVTRVSGSFVENYPLGSIVVPIERMFINNNSGYAGLTNNAAELELGFIPDEYRDLVGKGGVAAPTHTSDAIINPGATTRSVLERRPLSSRSQSIFDEKIDRLDHGQKIQVESVEVFAKITNGRQYLSSGREDRQFWKLFLDTIKGQLKSFYTSTYRPDMTIDTQPIQGGTSFIVLDDARVANIWETISTHSELAVATADGDTQYVTIDPALTVDNLDGTHTVEFAPALTNTPLGSTVQRVSFLELVRLSSDAVDIEYGHTNRVVKMAVRTVEA